MDLSRYLFGWATGDLLLGRYLKVRELGHGVSGTAWLVACATDLTLPSGARLMKGDEVVAKIINTKGTS
jgi:hypothetical protein